jgi:hypothetical protein
VQTLVARRRKKPSIDYERAMCYELMAWLRGCYWHSAFFGTKFMSKIMLNSKHPWPGSSNFLTKMFYGQHLARRLLVPKLGHWAIYAMAWCAPLSFILGSVQKQLLCLLLYDPMANGHFGRVVHDLLLQS